MASVKVVIRKKKNKDGTLPLTLPIALRITKDTKTTYIYLRKFAKEKEWDAAQQKVKRIHPNHKRLNALLLKKRTEAENVILEYELKKIPFSVTELKSRLGHGKSTDTFFEQAKIHFENLETAGNYNRLSAEGPAISHFKRFLKSKKMGDDIAFSDIKISLLEKYEAYLLKLVRVSKNNDKKKGLSLRTIANYLIIIRTLYKKAVKNKLVDPQHYPFGIDKFHITKPDSEKIGLNEEEVKRIEALDLPIGSIDSHARNLWLYSFYFAGMRISDVLLTQWSSFKDGRLFYTMKKNNKPGSLKVPEKALAILKQYKDQKQSKDDLVFPFLKLIDDFTDKNRVQRRIKEVVRNINFALQNSIAKKAKIDKKLTCHIARHTFGNLSGDKIPIQMLQKLYRHSSITTTVNYQKNFLHKEADDALDAVLDF